MKEKFTKGEWVVDYKGTIGHIKAVVKGEGVLTPTIARYDIVAPSLSDEERRANAILMSQSKNMYKELELSMEMLNYIWIRTGSFGAKNQAEDIAVLLAKARGE